MTEKIVFFRKENNDFITLNKYYFNLHLENYTLLFKRIFDNINLSDLIFVS